jgi:hypothetical protein
MCCWTGLRWPGCLSRRHCSFPLGQFRFHECGCPVSGGARPRRVLEIQGLDGDVRGVANHEDDDDTAVPGSAVPTARLARWRPIMMLVMLDASVSMTPLILSFSLMPGEMPPSAVFQPQRRRPTIVCGRPCAGTLSEAASSAVSRSHASMVARPVDGAALDGAEEAAEGGIEGPGSPSGMAVRGSEQPAAASTSASGARQVRTLIRGRSAGSPARPGPRARRSCAC